MHGHNAENSIHHTQARRVAMDVNVSCQLTRSQIPYMFLGQTLSPFPVSHIQGENLCLSIRFAREMFPLPMQRQAMISMVRQCISARSTVSTCLSRTPRNIWTI